MKTLIKNVKIVNEGKIVEGDVLIENDLISKIDSQISEEADLIIDGSGKYLLPGVIDDQVHFREPGLEHKEDLETGSLAAVLGGVTSVFEMPNTKPLTTSAETLEDKIRRGRHRMHCDFAFWVGGTRDNAKDVAELERLPGAAGIKVFMGSSTGNLLVEDDEGVRSILKNTRRRAAFHSEDEFRLKERENLRVEGDPSSHPVWRDVTTALQCTERLVGIARETGARIHVLHISTAEEIDFLQGHKDVATCEATPHHLTLSADEYATLGNLIQMNPPVREKRHRDGVWKGVDQGIIDVLGSDHAPHTLEEKQKSYPASPSGMTGVQTLVPIMLDHVNAGKLSLERFVDLSSHGPNRIFGMARKGRIAVGYDADLTIVDMKRRETITHEQAGSKAGWTPYHGKTVTGWPVGTFVRGIKVMWEAEIVNPNKGEPVEFLEALPRH